MKARPLTAILTFLLTCFVNAQQIDLSGIWSGKLSLPNTIKLTIVFNFAKDSSGNYTAAMDSPDQGAKGIPTESVIIV